MFSKSTIAWKCPKSASSACILPWLHDVTHQIFVLAEPIKKGVTVAIIKPNVVEEGKVEEVVEKVGQRF